jgi:hypothetical protein
LHRRLHAACHVPDNFNGIAHASLSTGGADAKTPRPSKNSSGTGLVVNIPQRLLVLFADGRLQARYPIAVGGHEWQTPVGAFAIVFNTGAFFLLPSSFSIQPSAFT